MHRLAPMFALLLVAAGCARPDLKEPFPVSSAWSAPEKTDLGRKTAARAVRHPGESGLYVLGSGLDAFAARILALEAAEKAIDVQYYIFHDDVTGRFLLARLLAAADRGVRVRLLLDDLSTGGLDSILAAADAHPNLEVRLFNGFARGPIPGLARALDGVAHPVRLNHRMHNKMLSVDSAVAVVGGRNVGDEYFDASEGVNFADLDLLVFGPVLEELGESFDLYWNSGFAAPASRWRRLRARSDALADLRRELEAHEEEQRESAYARRLRGSNLVNDVTSGGLDLYWAPTRAVADLPEKIVARGDEVGPTLLSRRLGPLFDEARTEMLIVSPYFVPRDSGTEFLRQAQERGVRVSILTNSLAATDVAAVHSGYARHRKALLEAGVELYELKPTGAGFQVAQRAGLLGSSSASLHAKTFSFDRETVFVGSLNLDPRSVDLNTELGLVVTSSAFAERQRVGFERVTAPEVAWRLRLEDGELVWEGVEGGIAERYTREPRVGFWRRVSVWFLGLLPIEGQL